MIIAVDYDGTLQIGEDMNLVLIRRLKHNQRRGDTIILWTCREGKSLIEALTRLRGCGFQPNLVNDNSPDVIRRMGGNTRKIYADVYLDDKAVKT